MNLMTPMRFSLCKTFNENESTLSLQQAFADVKSAAGMDIAEAVFIRTENSIKAGFSIQASVKDTNESTFEMPLGRYTFSQETINGSLGEHFEKMPPHVIIRLLVDDHHNVMQFWTPAG